MTLKNKRYFYFCILILLWSVWAMQGHAVPPRQFIAWQGETPPLKLKDLRGNVVSLEQYRGKVVLVNFWATWCGPCVEEMPSLQKLRDLINAQKGGARFEIIAVNSGEPAAKVNAFVQKSQLTFPILLEQDESVREAWKVNVMPSTFIIGKDGKIRYAYFGGADWASEEMVKRIDTIVAGKDKVR